MIGFVFTPSSGCFCHFKIGFEVDKQNELSIDQSTNQMEREKTRQKKVKWFKLQTLILYFDLCVCENYYEEFFFGIHTLCQYLACIFQSKNVSNGGHANNNIHKNKIRNHLDFRVELIFK